jgi:succinate-semialdehyde dehydrogenase / glutarate-semialdehyde dehydrogenase
VTSAELKLNPAAGNILDRLYVNGEWRPASDGGTFVVTDPATGETLAAVASATLEDGAAALAAADAAFAPWAARNPRDRAEVLRRVYELIIADREPLARLVTRENGKALADSRAEVAYAAEFFRWYSEEAVRNIGSLTRGPASGARIVVQHKPAGIGVLVTPWNYPAAMASRKIAPALAAGWSSSNRPPRRL